MSVGKCANRPPPTSGVFQAATVVEADQRLAEFETFWSAAYPSIVQIWRRNWDRIIPFFDYPPEICRNIYTINAIESVNMSLRKITKPRLVSQ
jgi:putative transposase